MIYVGVPGRIQDSVRHVVAGYSPFSFVVKALSAISVRKLRAILGPLGFNFSQHGPTTRPSVERTAEKAFMLSDRV